MAFRRAFERLRAPIEELDREALEEWVRSIGATPVREVVPRLPVVLAGEVSSVRIVPRAGSPSLEVTVTDGTGFATGIFLGRRRIAGLTPGRRLRFRGVPARRGRVVEIFNPVYEILV
ncbi:MAG TPA: OB-fold nucleic acid binding domain-containing protein [Acidimicrobiia bacterium]|nr:OB-fold nucleic acid binding domain-containing protein [Acidimicrobiia bacterium]